MQPKLRLRLLQHLSLQALVLALAGADHKGQQAGRPAELTAVKNKLSWRVRTRLAAQGQHRL